MPVVPGSIQLGNKDGAWFASNPTLVLLLGQHVDLLGTGLYKLGDGITDLQSLPFLGNPTVVQDGLQSGGEITVVTDDITVAPASWLISPNIYATLVNTNFLNITLSSSGNQRYIGFYGDTLNTITKVEGTEAPIASYPSTPVGTIVIGYVLVSDASISVLPDLSGYEEKINKVNTVIGNEADADKYLNIPALIAYLQANYNLNLQQVTDNGSTTTNDITAPKIKKGIAEVDLSDGLGVNIVGDYLSAPGHYSDSSVSESYTGSGFTRKKILTTSTLASLVSGLRAIINADDKIELRHDVVNEFNAPDNNVNGSFKVAIGNNILQFNNGGLSVYTDDGAYLGTFQVTPQLTTIQNDVSIQLNSPNIEVSQDPTTALGVVTKQYVDGLVDLTFKPAGNWDASGNTFPTTGTGSGGSVQAGDVYKTSVAGTPVGFETLDIGDSFYAIIDSPGQTASNWAKFETNTQQATESFRGTLAVSTQIEIEDNTSTNDIDAVTPKKWWQGFAKAVTLAWTWTANQIFSGTVTTNNDLIVNSNLILSQNSSGISGSNADLNSHSSTNIRLTNGGLVSLASISTTGVVTGHQIWLHNDTNNAITIVNNYGSVPGGSAKILTSYNEDVLIPTQASIMLEYDSTDSAFRLVNHNGFTSTLTASTPLASNSNKNTTSLTASIWGAWINGLSSKATPVDADQVVLMDSASSNTAKKLSWANIKATLASTFYLDATSSIQTQLNNKKDNIIFTALAGVFNPADSTTYYFIRIAPTTTATNHAMTFGYNGTIKTATLMAHGNSISGSSENCTIQFRNITQTTSSVISSTFTTNASSTSIISQTITGLNISFLGTDSISIQFDSPAYAINPISLGLSVYLTIEKTS